MRFEPSAFLNFLLKNTSDPDKNKHQTSPRCVNVKRIKIYAIRSNHFCG